MSEMRIRGGEEAVSQLYVQCASSVVGGSTLQNPRTIGGVEDIKEYANTVMSKAKEKLIRDIARDMKTKFKVEGKGATKVDINPEADLKTLISQLKKAIPDPNTNGRVWSSQIGSQKTACKQLARIINERYGFTSGTGMIDENADPEEICEKVSEVMYTLFVGMHGEFLNVREDALRLSQNLHLLQNILERNFKQLEAKLTNADPENVIAETKLAREGHEMIMGELKRQQAMLDNTLNVVVMPEDKELVKLLKQSKDFKRLVKKIKALPGTGKFGEKVAFVLSGVGTTAQMAQSVDEALKKASVSLAEYGRPKDSKELDEMLRDKLQHKLSGSSAKDLEQYMKAAKTLFRYEYNRPEIIAQLSKRGGEDEVEGSADADAVNGGMKLDKRVKEREDMKKALVGLFNKSLATHLERINVLTEKIAHGVGSSVPLSDALRQFVKRLELVPDIEKRHIFYALTGYYNDPESREAKALFLDGVKSLTESLEKMLKMSEYSKNEHMRDLLRAWQSIIALIHDYGQRFEQGFGLVHPKIGPSKWVGQAEDVTGGGPWWTAAQKGMEKAGVEGEEAQGKMYQEVIKPALQELKDAGKLSWEQFIPAVEELIKKATGKDVKIEDKSLDAEIAETKERLAAKTTGSPSESPKAKPSAKKPAAKGKKSHKKHGRGDESEDDSFGGDFEPEDSTFGGDEEDVMGGASTSAEISRLADNLTRSKDVMRFFFRAADIRKNMAYVAPELAEYSKDYPKVLGDAIARARDNIQKEAKDDLAALRDGKAGTKPLYDYTALRTALEEHPSNPAAVRVGAPLNDPLRNNTNCKLFVDERLKEIVNVKEKFYNTKINMLKCAEAMDLYMQHFTDGIVSNIDDVQKVEVMLRGTEIISKWFSTRSGNLICSVFDTFPGLIQNNAAGVPISKYSHLERTNDERNQVHYYWRVQRTCRLVDLPTALANVTQQEAVLGRKTDHLGTKDDSVVELRKLYTGLVDWTAFYADVRSKNIPNADNLEGVVAQPGNIGVPGIPYMGIPPCKEGSAARTPTDASKHNDALMAMDFVTKAFENVSVLKNLVAAFVAIGDKFGGKDLRKMIHMSPLQIYNALIEYMTIGSFTMGAQNPTVATVNARFTLVGQAAKLNSTLQPGQFTFSATSTGSVLTAYDNITVSMRPVDGIPSAKGDLFRSGEDAVDTDELFQLVVKAMIAKILTVIGVYNMIHRPIDRNTLGYASATRWTLGGADAYPKIIPEALELYVRLPLLAEFYREVLDFDNTPPGNPQRPWSALSMVPHMEGTFQGIVELIFDRTKHVKYGTYSDTDTRSLIEEINKIYMSFKGGKNMVSDVIHEFVSEINRRYGILIEQERKRYQKIEQDRYKERYDSSLPSDDRVDYDILPEELGSGIGPSDAFITEGSVPKGVDPHKWRLSTQLHKGFINQIRSRLDGMMDTVWPQQDTTAGADEGLEKLKQLSFENLIKARTEELKYARSAKEQFRVVQQAINGLGEFSMNAQERSLILFHETVVVGLNTLTALYAMVKIFHERLWKMGNTVKIVSDLVANGTIANNVNFIAANNNKSAMEQGDAAYVIVAPAGGVPESLRLGVNQNQLLQDFIELINGHCSSFGNMVEFQIESVDHPDCVAPGWLKTLLDANSTMPRPQSLAFSIDHSKMYELVQRELSTIKLMFNKFRGLISKEILDTYELDKNRAGADQKGSIYWLERHFVTELFSGKVSSWENNHLGRANEKARDVLNYVTKPWNFTTVPTPLANSYEQNNFGMVMGRLVSFDRNAGAITASAYDHNGILRVLNELTTGVAGGFVRFTPPPTVNKISLYDARNVNFSFAPANNYRSVLVSFNKLVASYLQQFYDNQSQKIYVNVINSFANGAFSDAVMKDNNFDDFATVDFRNTIKSVLFRSLAYVMRQLLIGKMPGKTFKHYLETDIAEIPLFMKESYKANMPIFIKLFSLLIKKCEMLKRFVQVLPVRPSAGPIDEDSAKTESNEILNKVILGSNALITCMNEVLEEMADAPVYLETHKDSIKEYEGLNGTKPLMPMSSLLYYLRNHADLVADGVSGVAGINNSTAMPAFNLGQNPFKLQYATRGILSVNGEHSLSKLVGVREIMQKHNETTEADYHMDEKNLAAHVSDSLEVLSYIIDARHYVEFLTTRGTVGATMLGSSLADNTNNTINLGLAVYSLRNNISSVMQITEASRQRDSRQNLVKRIEQSDKTIVRGTRADIRMMNIIDMNIVPININALMREVPLVNLLNYSYTYDSMICNLLGVDKDMVNQASYNQAPFDASTPVRERARKYLGLMLINPYMPVDENQYHDLFARIVRGQTGISGLGRPKFLGDELYGKALFGEVYSNEKYWDEAGPMVGQAREAPSNEARKMLVKNILSSRLSTFGGNLTAWLLNRGNDTNALLSKLYEIVSDRRTRSTAANEIKLLIDAANGVPFHMTLVDIQTLLQDIQTALNTQNNGNFAPSNTLNYLHPTKDGKGEIIQVDVGLYKPLLQAIGKLRFDTFYCRSLVWLTNIQRVLRLKLRNDLEWYDSRIVTDNLVTSSDITEQYGNEAHQFSARNYQN